jgi:hypothetical protein
MPSFSGRVEYLQPGQGAVLSGACEVSFDDRTLTIVHGGPALAFDLGDIDVFEADDCRIRLSLFNGHAVLLTRFAKAFQDLERQLREAYRDRLVVCLLVSDLQEVLRVGGRASLEGTARDGKACDGPAELRLYDSNLAVLPDASRGFQWRLADIEKVEFDEANYRVVLAQGDERLAVGKLAKRTGEFAEAVQSRMSALGQRSARALHAVFPFLTPDQFTSVAALMREGACAPVGALRRIHALTEPALLEQAVDAALAPYVKALAGRCVADWYAGCKIIREEIDPATGEEGELAETVEETEETEGAEPVARADERNEAVFAAGDGLEVLYWFFFPIAAGGEAPTHVAWEATSRGGRATYVFALEPGQSLDAAVAALNRGLAALSFRREPVSLQTARLESDVRYRHYAIALRRMPELVRLRSLFAGRAIHTSLPSWSKTIDRLVGHQPA